MEVKAPGAIAGRVTFKGPVPPPRTIRIDKDRPTCKHHPALVPLIVVDDQGNVSEAVVSLADVDEGKGFSRADSRIKVNQHGCRFRPHVQAFPAGTTVKLVNSDPVAHNVNATKGGGTLFNILQPHEGMSATYRFDESGVVTLKCNVHDWMSGYLHVMEHPYYQVTGTDGAFRLKRVPPGKYSLRVWQEHLGERSMAVVVEAGKTTELNIELTAAPANSRAAK